MKKRTDGTSVAFLFQSGPWEAGPEPIELVDGLTLGPIEGSVEGRLYRKLCEEKGIDDHHPLNVCARFDPSPGEPWGYSFEVPFMVIDRLSNLLTIATETPVNRCRVMMSSDRFASADFTQIVFSTHGAIDLIGLDSPPIPLVTEEIVALWENEQRIWDKRDSSEFRLLCALDHFHRAWRAVCLEQTSLNLGIAVNLLFGPEWEFSAGNPTWVNAAHFALDQLEEDRSVLVLVEDVCKWHSEVAEGTVRHMNPFDAFQLVARMLKTILLDEKLARQFSRMAVTPRTLA